jgi:hypothetical protein
MEVAALGLVYRRSSAHHPGRVATTARRRCNSPRPRGGPGSIHRTSSIAVLLPVSLVGVSTRRVVKSNFSGRRRVAVGSLMRAGR